MTKLKVNCVVLTKKGLPSRNDFYLGTNTWSSGAMICDTDNDLHSAILDFTNPNRE